MIADPYTELEDEPVIDESHLWPKPAFDSYRVSLGEGTYRKLPYPHDE